MLKHLMPIAIILSLFACTTEQKKPEAKWEVKTTTASNQKIWVTRADGSRQCASKKAKVPGPAQVAEQMKASGILVFQSRAGNDGQMHAQKCGAPTGNTVELEISRADLRRALEMGFVSKAD